jgi:hypothetical protein
MTIDDGHWVRLQSGSTALFVLIMTRSLSDHDQLGSGGCVEQPNMIDLNDTCVR